MNLALINYEFPPLGGGAGRATQALACELARLGHQAVVLTTRYKTQPLVEERDGYTILRVSAPRRQEASSNPLEMLGFMLSAGLRAAGLFKKFRPQVCLAFFGIPGGPVAWMVKRSLGVPYVVLLRGGDIPGAMPEQMAWLQKASRPLIRRIWSSAALVVANSGGKRDLALATGWGIPVEVLPNGIDAQFYNPGAGCRDGQDLEILFVGRLSAVKGLDYLLLALGRVGQARPDLAWCLKLVGGGPRQTALREQARALGIESRLEFLGWLDSGQVAELYRRSGIFVLPSLDEGMPNALLEAMASGLPCLATRVPGSEELIQDGHNGFLVPPADAAALASRLELLLGNAELCRELGRRARSSAEQRSWSSVTQRLLAMLQPVVSPPWPR
jgi:glycosyltransferase involved in cell wall biosynthesis